MRLTDEEVWSHFTLAELLLGGRYAKNEDNAALRQLTDKKRQQLEAEDRERDNRERS